MEFKHTPRPWFFCQTGNRVKRAAEHDPVEICFLPIGAGHSTAEDRANGRLIAAAPELLAFVRKFSEANRKLSAKAIDEFGFDPFEDDREWLEEAEALMARVMGKD